jgi:hypothetical protein
MSSIVRMLSILMAIALFGCGVEPDQDDDDNPGTDTDTDTDGDSDTDADSDADTDSDSDGDSGPDTDDICDEQNIEITKDPAQVLILQDHSSSMAGGNWDIARNAIYSLLTTFEDTSLEFGLDTFPDPTVSGCYVDAPVVIDCGPDTETAIADALEGMTTVSMTPLYDALNNFTDPDYAPGCTATPYNKYILLIADGEDSCSSPSVSDFVSLTSLLVELDIKVIVVGFNVVYVAETLNAIAANGGTTFTTYLNASDEPTLTAALATIGTSIIDCVFTIDEPDASANPDLVNFYFDGELLYMDEDCSSGSGWRWVNDEHTQVEFCADSCQEIKDDLVDTITATFGCETIIE